MIRTYGGITSSDVAIVPDNVGIVWSDAVIAAARDAARRPGELAAGWGRRCRLCLCLVGFGFGALGGVFPAGGQHLLHPLGIGEIGEGIIPVDY